MRVLWLCLNCVVPFSGRLLCLLSFPTGHVITGDISDLFFILNSSTIILVGKEIFHRCLINIVNTLLGTIELFAAFASIDLVTASIDYKRFAKFVNSMQLMNLIELFYNQGKKLLLQIS